MTGRALTEPNLSLVESFDVFKLSYYFLGAMAFGTAYCIFGGSQLGETGALFCERSQTAVLVRTVYGIFASDNTCAAGCRTRWSDITLLWSQLQ